MACRHPSPAKYALYGLTCLLPGAFLTVRKCTVHILCLYGDTVHVLTCLLPGVCTHRGKGGAHRLPSSWGRAAKGLCVHYTPLHVSYAVAVCTVCLTGNGGYAHTPLPVRYAIHTHARGEDRLTGRGDCRPRLLAGHAAHPSRDPLRRVHPITRSGRCQRFS
jgi:hypothetical protein